MKFTDSVTYLYREHNPRQCHTCKGDSKVIIKNGVQYELKVQLY